MFTKGSVAFLEAKLKKKEKLKNLRVGGYRMMDIQYIVVTWQVTRGPGPTKHETILEEAPSIRRGCPSCQISTHQYASFVQLYNEHLDDNIDNSIFYRFYGRWLVYESDQYLGKIS